MPPEPLDPRYVQARRVLLDALFALAPHGAAIIVAGAQAIYLHTGDADFAIAPFTLDGDVAINPSLLGDDPQLEAAMRGAGFDLSPQTEGHVEPGIWVTSALIEGHRELIPVDLIVPEGAVGGRRGARLGVHGNRAARRIPGLEAGARIGVAGEVQREAFPQSGHLGEATPLGEPLGGVLGLDP
jgi:hypothetical protein